MLTMSVTDSSKIAFQGGDLIGTITSPTGKWVNNLNFSVPTTDPGQSYAFVYPFHPVEPGLYVIQFQSFQMPRGQFGQTNTTTIKGGYFVFNVEDVSAYYTEVLSYASIGGTITALVAIFTAVVFNRRRIQQVEKQLFAEQAVVIKPSLSLEKDSKGVEWLTLDILNQGPGRVLGVEAIVKTIGSSKLPTGMKYKTTSLAIGETKKFLLNIPTSVLSGSEQFDVRVTPKNIFGEKLPPTTTRLGLADLPKT